MENQKKIMMIFGTRPEAIKMSPLVKQIEGDARFESIVVVTAQHRQMLDQVLDVFEIKPDYDLDIMKERQSLNEITGNVLKLLDEVLLKENPDIVFVHGDTTTTFAASLAAFYRQIPIGHVEAGLRTWDKYSPFPEEMNRQMTDVLADVYFAPTKESKQNLLKENHSEKEIFVTGNTAIDAMKYTVQNDYHHELVDLIGERRVILVTMHRRENLGEPMTNVFQAINHIVEQYEDVEIIFPIHKNPVVRQNAQKTLIKSERIHVIEPLDVVDFQNFAKRSFLILSDSGGVQEEAPSLGVPVLVLRDTTERPEGVSAGTLKVVGTEKGKVIREVEKLLDNEEEYLLMAKAKNPYGDGHASERILNATAYYLGITNEKPEEF
ncbi:non-hydrolyzing UDP-N-acetylglucosamine 2-epimerase [Enterococcus sp. 1001283B150225_161107_E12]|uniref:non-hydrolyzing UDP-N-acetylglucosamine 2-epimerase n=1 Tax=Enterococcus sp. 1001283B150225_161107_E12 TaxID=2787145 RepID=UPI00189DA1B5|nr:UDP-N-acetylglucosamine 2-epimerase (non-hydrolyzing) [Enterococcus sp. 1001283B150225_161107_E12]